MFPIPASIPTLICALLLSVLGTPLLLWATRLSPRKAGWRWTGWRGLAVGSAWGCLLAVFGVAWLFFLLHTGNYLPIAVVPTALDWFLLVMLLPVAEEAFFRGAIFGGLQRSWRPFWAVILSAMLYVVAHAAEPWLAFVFLNGIGYAYAFRQSGSVVSPMLAHILAVGTVLIARVYPEALMHLSPFWLAGAGSIALLAVFFVGKIRHAVRCSP